MKDSFNAEIESLKIQREMLLMAADDLITKLEGPLFEIPPAVEKLRSVIKMIGELV